MKVKGKPVFGQGHRDVRRICESTQKHTGGSEPHPRQKPHRPRKHRVVVLEGGHILSLTSWLYRTARLSATARATTKGPRPLAKRAARITIGRTLARTGIFRWPK